jgi:hypothetical protein
LVEIARKMNTSTVERLRAERNYEALEMYILDCLMGRT